VALAVAAVVFVLYIDDWSRDFTTHHAEISELSSDETLRPLTSRRSTEEILEAVRWAGRRIRNWEYVGDAEDGDTTMVVFVRTNRLLRFKDDVTIRVQDRGNERVVVGESRSRLGIGDLGRNPRNLRRFLDELRGVLGE
jgi:ABC-type molybdenum transport system ATPase subunit/photorepair protein PhrA